MHPVGACLAKFHATPFTQMSIVPGYLGSQDEGVVAV
jgi:hypothetical protein